MFVRKLKRKTTQNIAVQIVRNDRTKDGKVRQRIVRYMGTAPEGPALEALLHIAEQERLRIEEESKPSLFPSEHSAHAALEARRRKPSDQPIPLEDIRKLEEVKRICVGFHEVFGALYMRMGFDQLFSKRHAMAARLFRQAVLLRLGSPGDSKLAHARQLSKEDGVEVPTACNGCASIQASRIVTSRIPWRQQTGACAATVQGRWRGSPGPQVLPHDGCGR